MRGGFEFAVTFLWRENPGATEKLRLSPARVFRSGTKNHGFERDATGARVDSSPRSE
jgi:hypothetical protein